MTYNKFVCKQKEITKSIFDLVNHTRFPKEDHLPDCAYRDKHGNKGDRVEHIHLVVCTGLCSSVSVLEHPCGEEPRCSVIGCPVG